MDIQCSDISLCKIIEDTFIVFVKYGGLGSGSRNGFGQLQLLNNIKQNNIKKIGRKFI